MGLGRVYLEPKALAGGTAAPPARGAGVLFSMRHPGARGKEGAVPCDAALPRWGKGRCRCAGSTLFAPAGQKRFRVGAPDFGRVAGQRWMKKRFAYQERSGRRARKTKHTVLRSMRPPRPRNHPAGRTAGSARTRSRDQSLENPFLGTARPQRRRRQAPARGPAAVYSLHRPNRNVPQRPSPLLVGLGRVYLEPTATGRRHCRLTCRRRSWRRWRR